MTNIEVGKKYINYMAGNIKYEVLAIENDRVKFKTLHSGNISEKTLHWCQKNFKEMQ